MFKAQNRETNQYLKSCCALQDHFNDERDKIIFHNTTQNLQDQTRACKSKTMTDFFWSQTGLVLRPTVSDHITGLGSAVSSPVGFGAEP